MGRNYSFGEGILGGTGLPVLVIGTARPPAQSSMSRTPAVCARPAAVLVARKKLTHGSRGDHWPLDEFFP
jgi:hypothetical protein